jgi:large subunit ribosomal protein L13
LAHVVPANAISLLFFVRMKTFSATPTDITHQWFIVDADGLVLGRLASEVARIIRGKHKPIFTPHMDTGDMVIVINASKVRVTGRKATQKKYFRHSGYMGHESYVPFATQLAKHPERVIEHAVYGMLPKSTLSRQVLRRKLRVFAGTEHPHAAQQPKALTFSKTSE